MRKENIPAIKALNLLRGRETLNFLQLAGTLWRGKLWILLFMTVALLLGGYYAFRVAVPLYTSTTTVALESRDNQVVDFQSVVSGLSADQATINTEVEVLRARILIGKVIDALDLMSDPEFNTHLQPENPWSLGAILRRVGLRPPRTEPTETTLRDRAISEVLDIVAIRNIRNSYVFKISAVTEQPAKAAMIADTLSRFYIEDQLTTKLEATEKATNWLTDRVAELKAELETAETAAKDYNSSIALIGPEALALLNRQLKDIRARLANSEQDLAEHISQIAAMEAAQASDNVLAMAAAANDATLTAAANRAINDQGARAAFDARFAELLTRARIARDRESAQEAALRSSVEDIEAKVNAQSADLVVLQQLEREAAASGLIYEYFLGRLKETSVQEGIHQPDARILSFAVVPELPSKPRKSVILALSMIGGLVLGSALVLLREMRHTGFRNAADLEAATGVTVIGQIPRAPNARRRKVLDYIVSKPTSALVEAVRNLRTSILLSKVDKPPKVIMLTSSVPGEGKTTQTLALSQNLAGLGRKVLVIEGDIRRRTFAEYFDISGKKGLLSAVAGDAKLEDVVWHSEQLGVDILIGEKTAINAADFFSSDSFVQFMVKVRDAYDVILIDTPPVLVVPDARVIAPHADAVLYVVHWDHTPRAQVEQGLHAFDTVDTKVTGMVLSQIDTKGMRRYGEEYGVHGNKYYGN
ncbi:MAG: polysaccharide biosynthesis tyrosine autokinase [Paracoccaceae bacterium]